MRRYVGPIEFPPGRDPRALTVFVTAGSTSEAAETALDATEWVIDYLAFSFACHIPIITQQIEVIGGREVSVGEPMDIPKFRKTAVGLHATWQCPFALIDRPEAFCENRRAALRWYHKGMETAYDIDRFIFFWISLEILAKAARPELVPVPFRHTCGYEIHECPGCGEALARTPTGEAAVVASFMSQLGVADGEIKVIREFRQVVHGKGRLTLAGTRDVERYNEVLRRSVNLALKRALGIPDTSPPLLKASLFSRNSVLNYSRVADDESASKSPRDEASQ